MKVDKLFKGDGPFLLLSMTLVAVGAAWFSKISPEAQKIRKMSYTLESQFEGSHHKAVGTLSTPSAIIRELSIANSPGSKSELLACLAGQGKDCIAKFAEGYLPYEDRAKVLTGWTSNDGKPCIVGISPGSENCEVERLARYRLSCVSPSSCQMLELNLESDYRGGFSYLKPKRYNSVVYPAWVILKAVASKS